MVYIDDCKKISIRMFVFKVISSWMSIFGSYQWWVHWWILYFPKILGTRFNGNFNSYRVKVVELKKQGKEIITGG